MCIRDRDDGGQHGREAADKVEKNHRGPQPGDGQQQHGAVAAGGVADAAPEGRTGQGYKRDDAGQDADLHAVEAFLLVVEGHVGHEAGQSPVVERVDGLGWCR